MDWGVEWDHMTANPPRVGNMSVTAPRVCTHGEFDFRDQIMEHTRDRHWNVSLWERLGCPGERGQRTRDPIPQGWGMCGNLGNVEWPAARVGELVAPR